MRRLWKTSRKLWPSASLWSNASLPRVVISTSQMTLDVSAKIWTIETLPLRHRSTPSRSSANLGRKPVVGEMSERHLSINAVVSTMTIVEDIVVERQEQCESESNLVSYRMFHFDFEWSILESLVSRSAWVVSRYFGHNRGWRGDAAYNLEVSSPKMYKKVDRFIVGGVALFHTVLTRNLCRSWGKCAPTLTSCSIVGVLSEGMNLMPSYVLTRFLFLFATV